MPIKGNSKITMQLKQRINAFAELGKFLPVIENDFEKIIRKAEAENGWFVPENINFALNSWSEALSEKNITKWISKSKIEAILNEFD